VDFRANISADIERMADKTIDKAHTDIHKAADDATTSFNQQVESATSSFLQRVQQAFDDIKKATTGVATPLSPPSVSESMAPDKPSRFNVDPAYRKKTQPVCTNPITL
jgi:hypothetical protein